jgi:hypothetical protein
MNEITTSNVISWPSSVSRRMLLIVGEGVNEFRNLTSESQDGRRLYGSVVTLEWVDPKLDDIAGKNSVEKAFFISLSSIGSPEEKPNIDAAGSSGDCATIELVSTARELVVNVAPSRGADTLFP